MTGDSAANMEPPVNSRTATIVQKPRTASEIEIGPKLKVGGDVASSVYYDVLQITNVRKSYGNNDN